MTTIVPYSFGGMTDYPHLAQQQQPATPGEIHGVYILLHPDHREMALQRFLGWFTGREEIVLVDTGLSDKVGLGYILLEWMECEIDQLFLAFLRDEESIADYTTYVHEPED